MSTTTAPEPTRRDFIYIATGAVAGVGAALTAWPFIDQMNPSSAVLALASIEQDISSIAVGGQAVFNWRGHPLFVRRRTPKEIEELKAVNIADLPDPLARNANLPDDAQATDADRAAKDAPKVADPRWCLHASRLHADRVHATGAAGRIRRLALPLPWLAVRHCRPHPQRACAAEPAVPPYAFLTPTRIKVG